MDRQGDVPIRACHDEEGHQMELVNELLVAVSADHAWDALTGIDRIAHA